MGAWGSGPFDNDDAMDWSYRLVEGAGPEVVSDTLSAVLRADPPGLSAASNAVAAAAVVAAGLGMADTEIPAEVRDWLATLDPSAWLPLASLAGRALRQVLTASELKDLWDEAEDGAWAAETGLLHDRIAAAGGPS